ncbi:MAG: hypothetical protein ACOX9E_14820 [Lentisphaeria bacterium]
MVKRLRRNMDNMDTMDDNTSLPAVHTVHTVHIVHSSLREQQLSTGDGCYGGVTAHPLILVPDQSRSRSPDTPRQPPLYKKIPCIPCIPWLKTFGTDGVLSNE